MSTVFYTHEYIKWFPPLPVYYNVVDQPGIPAKYSHGDHRAGRDLFRRFQRLSVNHSNIIDTKLWNGINRLHDVRHNHPA